MKLNRTEWLSLGLVAVGFAASALLYDRLPDPMPTHWSSMGEPDGFTAKPLGAFMMPLVMAGVWLLMIALPRVSPRGYRLDRFAGAFEAVHLSILGFMLWVTLLGLLSGAGRAFPMDTAVQAGVGLLFIVLGNFMGKFTRNFFVGIRTPWTLAHEEVWLRTHRLGGKLFVLSGLLIGVAAFAGVGMVLMTPVVLLMSLVLVAYSYLVYRKLERAAADGPGDDSGEKRCR
jgi:uncharacterized membrane protein